MSEAAEKAKDGETDVAAALAAALKDTFGADTKVAGLRRLSGGASQETWAFNAEHGGGTEELILRRAPGGTQASTGTGSGIPLETEAALIGLSEKQNVPVPPVVKVLTDADGLGAGFVMRRVEGETIARKILRDDEYADARPKLARQCGEIMARIHQVPLDDLPPLRTSAAKDELERYREIYDAFDYPHPVFELAFRYLEDNVPEDARITLVHGDFRNGNLMIGPDGVRAVLDWELGHIGDPMEDLGWICVNSWRFGEVDNPVGGFGQYQDMFDGYEAVSGLKIDPERVKFWEVLGTLKWGIMCMGMYSAFANSHARSVERAAIGRRSSETEIDLLNLLAPRSGPATTR